MYYLLNDKRDRPNKNKKLTTVGKYLSIVHCDKLKKDKYFKKVSEVFKEKGKQIGKVELAKFNKAKLLETLEKQNFRIGVDGNESN